MRGVRYIILHDLVRFVSYVFCLIGYLIADWENPMNFFYVIATISLLYQIYFAFRAYESLNRLYPECPVFYRYYRVKLSVVLLISVAWAGVFASHWTEEDQGNLILISLVIYISEAWDIYFAYVVYSAGMWIAKINAEYESSINSSPTSRGLVSQVPTITFFSTSPRVHPLEGIRTEPDELFQRSEPIEIASPISDQNEKPPRLEIELQDLTEKRGS